MNVLVTGANGFIGYHLCRTLQLHGHSLTALCHRRTDRIETLCGPNLSLLHGELHDSELMHDALVDGNVQAVCHLAVAPPGTADSDATWRVNVEGTRQLLDVCRNNGTERFVFASTMSVYDFLAPAYLPVDEAHPCAPQQSYGREKLQAEEECCRVASASDLAVSVLRIAGVYGPHKRAGAVYNFIRSAMDGERIDIAVNRRLDLVHVEDVAGAMVGAVERPDFEGCVIINVGSGRSVSLRTLAETVCGQLNARVPIVCGEEGGEFVLAVERAHQMFGYEPRSLRAGVTETINWMKANAA